MRWLLLFAVVGPVLLGGCGSTPYSLTELVCSEVSPDYPSVIFEVVSVTLLDSDGNPVVLADPELHLTQTLQEVANGSLNYDLFPDYSYFSKLQFSYIDGNNTVTVTLMIDPEQSYSLTSALPLVATINGVEKALQSTTSGSGFIPVHNVSLEYTTTQGQDRQLGLTLSYVGTGPTETVYSQAVLCNLDCEDIVVFPLGDGTHKIACDYSCANGTKGDFESATEHSDADFNELSYLYDEEEIQAIASSCSFASYALSSGATLTDSFTVVLNE